MGVEMSLERTKGSFSISRGREVGGKGNASPGRRGLGSPRPQSGRPRPPHLMAHAHLRCCCSCSSDTRKKKRRLLLVRKSWRRLLSVRLGMSNSSFSAREAESWVVLPRPLGPSQLVLRVTTPSSHSHTPSPARGFLR